MEDTAWTSGLKCRWKQVRATTLSKARLDKFVDSVAAWVDDARKRHFARWPILGTYVWPNPQPIPATYEEEVSTLKSWLNWRLQWIDDNLPDTGPCADVGQIEGTLQAKAYPNPVTDNMQVELLVKVSQQVELRVVDMMGRVMMTKSAFYERGIHRMTVNTVQWLPGLYFLEVSNGKGEGGTYRLLKM
jgi:hypothetical protein